VPREQRAQFVGDVQEEIDALRQAKRPMFSRQELLNADTVYYNDKLAKEIRAGYETLTKREPLEKRPAAKLDEK
jgi:hypothetical protein